MLWNRSSGGRTGAARSLNSMPLLAPGEASVLAPPSKFALIAGLDDTGMGLAARAFPVEPNSHVWRPPGFLAHTPVLYCHWPVTAAAQGGCVRVGSSAWPMALNPVFRLLSSPPCCVVALSCLQWAIPCAQVPDFLVLGEEAAWLGAGGVLAAGYLGNEYEYRPDLSYPR